MCNLICEVLLQSVPQASQLKGFPLVVHQYKCFMQIRHHPPAHILTGAVVRLNQYVSPHHPRIAYSQVGQGGDLQNSWYWAQKRDYKCILDEIWETNQYDNIA